MKRRRRKKSATEYGRERREAQCYADDVAGRAAAQLSRYSGIAKIWPQIARPAWLHSWGVAFDGYLAGLRRKQRKDPSKK